MGCHFLLQPRCLCFSLHSYLQQGVMAQCLQGIWAPCPTAMSERGNRGSSAPLQIPRKQGLEHCSLPQIFDELFPPLEYRTHRSSLACCHQMFAVQKCRLSLLSWILFPTPEPLEAAGCLCPLTSCASDSKPNTSTTGRRNTNTTSTAKHKELGIALPGKHSPVLQTCSAWCHLQKQKLSYTCTCWENFCVDLKLPDHNLIGKSKSKILKERAKRFCKTMTNFFLWFGICELPRVLQMPGPGKADCPIPQNCPKAPAGMRNLVLTPPHTALPECKSSAGHPTKPKKNNPSLPQVKNNHW